MEDKSSQLWTYRKHICRSNWEKKQKSVQLLTLIKGCTVSTDFHTVSPQLQQYFSVPWSKYFPSFQDLSACYIDDILITGKDDKEHFTHLEAVLEGFKEHGLTIKMSKCHFLQSSVEYLGKIITKEGIQPSQKKIEAILKVKEPTDGTQLKSFLGMVNHYSKFLKCLADLSAPLNNLLKKDVSWEWTQIRTSKQL